MHKYPKLYQLSMDLGCKVLENEDMSKHTSFLIGGPADIFIEVSNKEALKKIINITQEEKIPVFILGNGSNILVSDNGIKGAVIKLCGDFSQIKLLNDNRIECGSAVSLSKLCSFALKNSLSGLEFAWGIPGSVGGAVYMNAGAYGGEIKDVIFSSSHIDTDNQEKTLEKDKLEMSYRTSFYSNKNHIITSSIFQLTKDSYENIKDRMDDYINRRKSKQPLDFPSAGSVFKRPEGYFAGTLIEQCGLKGKSINDAMVSTKHCGFIINKGNAKCEDVLNLVSYIQDTVKNKTGVSLKCEIKKVGHFNK